MSLPELVQKNAEKLCAELCTRLNDDPVEQRLFGFQVEGEALTLYTRSASGVEMTTRPLARFRYSKELGQWSLQFFDEEERWRPYMNAGPSLNLGQLIVHVEQDPFGFFRGDPEPPELA